MTFDQIVDLAVDENFEVFINNKGDLAGVRGRAAFEQEVVIRLTDRMRDIIGEPAVDEETVTKLAETYARRVATAMDQLENVSTFRAEFSDEEVDTLEVTIVYNTGEMLEFDIES